MTKYNASDPVSKGKGSLSVAGVGSSDEVDAGYHGGAFGTIRNWAIALLSLGGVADSAYLTYIHFRGGDYFCAGLGDCDYVNNSPYASFAGVPVALLGLAVYATLFAAALIVIRGPEHLAQSVAPMAIFGLSFGGVLASAYFTYVELFILHAI